MVGFDGGGGGLETGSGRLQVMARGRLSLLNIGGLK